MKNLLKITLLSGLFFTAYSAQANEEYSLTVKSEDKKSIRFSIEEAQQVQLTLSEANDRIVYEEKINAAAASSKTYDLNALPDGDYVFKVESGSTITKYPIHIEGEKAIVANPTVEELFKPVLTKGKGEVILNIANIEGPVEIEILDEYKDQLYKKTFSNVKQLTQKFDTTKTPARELNFIIKSKSHEFNYIVEAR